MGLVESPSDVRIRSYGAGLLQKVLEVLGT